MLLEGGKGATALCMKLIGFKFDLTSGTNRCTPKFVLTVNEFTSDS